MRSILLQKQNYLGLENLRKEAENKYTSDHLYNGELKVCGDEVGLHTLTLNI